MSLLLGYDIGSSSIKAALLDAATGQLVASAVSPDAEFPISSPHPGWAEQDPAMWWRHVIDATARLRGRPGVDLPAVKAVGVSYQMHGLVVVGSKREALRPAIIWCDSRSVPIGDRAARSLGHDRCLRILLNLPGNFTASKLRWVRENEPDVYARIDKAMLPGDYVAMRMTDTVATTPSGLSEMTLWDFSTGGPARLLLQHFDIDPEILPGIVPTFAIQGELTQAAAGELGLAPGTPVAYRAGDQPNNAFALNVLDPGEIAATAGTSGVVYGVADQKVSDERSRVNTFVHVNHRPEAPRYGALLCINGTGALNSWLKRVLGAAGPIDYDEMNALAERAPAGSDGLLVLPFGNGAERTLENRDPGAAVGGLAFNRHGREHLLRAAQEGIVFALHHGMQILREMGIAAETVRAGRANMFLSPLFRRIFAAVTGAVVELFNTDGAQGAARGAGLGAGIFADRCEAHRGLETLDVIEPDRALAETYLAVYERWKGALGRQIAP